MQPHTALPAIRYGNSMQLMQFDAAIRRGLTINLNPA